MLGELRNIPTETLIDIICAILTGDMALTLSDVAELKQIQRELQHRSDFGGWVRWVN